VGIKHVLRASAGIVLAFVVAGCAGVGAAPSAEDLITKTMTDWKTAIEAGDVDAAMMEYSDSYADPEGRGKGDLQAFLEGAADQGYLEGVEVGLEDMIITLSVGEATAGPVSMYGNFGGIDLLVTLVEEDGEWLITSADEY
jgi:hypothetical protein